MSYSRDRCSDWANNEPCGRKNWKFQQPWKISALFEVGNGMFPSIVLNLNVSTMKLKPNDTHQAECTWDATRSCASIPGAVRGKINSPPPRSPPRDLGKTIPMDQQPSENISPKLRALDYETYWCFIAGFFQTKIVSRHRISKWPRSLSQHGRPRRNYSMCGVSFTRPPCTTGRTCAPTPAPR
jgi:hypothetical protein